MLLVSDYYNCNLQLYSRRDGKLIHTSNRLESNPGCISLISKTEVAVCLLWTSKIVIMSFKSIDDIKLVKTFDLSSGFDSYLSVAKLNSEELVVSGLSKYGSKLCWCVVSITNGRVVSIHNICKGLSLSKTHLAMKDNTIYISCQIWSTNRGVYAYDIFNPHTQKFWYRHKELKYPWTIMAGRDSIFVCDGGNTFPSDNIHQLTYSGQLVTIYRVKPSPHGIFYDDQHGILYTTSEYSNKITLYTMESLYHPGTQAGKETKGSEKEEVSATEKVPTTSSKKEKLHQTVLNRCLPKLILDLDVNVVMIYIQQKGLFHDVTIRDILDQQTTTDKISKLIDQIKQRDQATYQQFKECLVLAQRADLYIMLEEDETTLAAEMKENQ